MWFVNINPVLIKPDFSCQFFHLWIILHYFRHLFISHLELNKKLCWLTKSRFSPYNPENMVRTSLHVLIRSSGPAFNVLSFWLGGTKLLSAWLKVISLVATIVNYTWETLEHTGLFLLIRYILMSGGLWSF